MQLGLAMFRTRGPMSSIAPASSRSFLAMVAVRTGVPHSKMIATVMSNKAVMLMIAMNRTATITSFL